MKKTSTIFYSIHDLASKATFESFDTSELGYKNEFKDIYSLLGNTDLFDVDQKVVDKILETV